MSWVATVRNLLRRRRHASLEVPAPPSAERLTAARQESERATEVLHQVCRRDPIVRARQARADEIYRENNLGPKFWAALGDRR